MTDCHAYRYAAGERLAKAARESMAVLLRHEVFAQAGEQLERLRVALAEYERTRDAR